MFHFNFKPRINLSKTKDSFEKLQHYKAYVSVFERIYIRFVAVLMILAAIVLSTGLFFSRLDTELDNYDYNLRLSLDTVHQRMLLSSSIINEQYADVDSFIYTETALTKLHLLNTPREEWPDAISLLTDPEDNVEFYYIEGMMESFSSSNAQGLGLSRDELTELTDEGILETDDSGIVNLYACDSIYNGYLVTMYRNVGSLSLISYRAPLDSSKLASSSYSYISYNLKSGRLYSDNGSVLTERTINDIDIKPIFDNSIDIDDPAADYSGFEIIHHLNEYRTCSLDIEDNDETVDRIMLYYRVRDCFDNVLSDIILPVAYILLTAFILIVSASVLRFVRSSARAESEIVRIGHRLAFDKLILRRECSLFGIVAVIVTLILVYVAALSDISRQNMEASYDLSSIINAEKTANADTESCNAIRDSNKITDLNKLAAVIEGNPNLRTNEMLKTVADTLNGCRDITIFGQDGLSVASSSGYIGYRLSDSGDPDENGNDLTSVLNTSLNHYLTPPDDSGISYYAVKSSFNSGVILFTATNNLFSDITDRMTGSSIMIEADFGKSDVIYYHTESEKTLYLAKAGAHTTQTVANTLDESALHDNYCGIRTINDTRYLINVAADTNLEGNYFIDALPVTYIFESVGSILIAFVICLLIILAFIILLFVPFRTTRHSIINLPAGYTEDIDNAPHTSVTEAYAASASAADISDGSDSASDDHDNKNKAIALHRSALKYSELSFVNSMNQITAGCILLFLAYLIFGIVTGNRTGSLVGYLFSSEWERGLNIFSVTLSVIIIFSVWAISVILHRLINVVSQNAGPQEMTALKLIDSFTRFAALIASIIMVLTQFGVRTGSILAGAGLTSVVLGIGAQSTVSNILAGLFIIFEGNFKVGDIVDINGWVGRIKEIGVRSTCIESFGDSNDFRNIRVINNSDFNNIVNRSTNPSRAVADIMVNINTDTDRIGRIFKQNAKRIHDSLIEPLSDINYWGVTEYQEAYKIIRFTVNTSELNRVDNQLQLINELGSLFEGEGLILDTYDTTLKLIAPADVILHNADTDAHTAVAANGNGNDSDTVSDAAADTDIAGTNAADSTDAAGQRSSVDKKH